MINYIFLIYFNLVTFVKLPESVFQFFEKYEIIFTISSIVITILIFLGLLWNLVVLIKAKKDCDSLKYASTKAIIIKIVILLIISSIGFPLSFHFSEILRMLF